MIGIRTENVFAFGTRKKRCAVCEAAIRMGRKARVHDCRLNWPS